MLPTDPPTLTVIVIKVDLANVVQQSPNEGHTRAQRPHLMLQAERRCRSGYLMAMFNQTADMIVMMVMAGLGLEKGMNNGIIHQHTSIEFAQRIILQLRQHAPHIPQDALPACR